MSSKPVIDVIPAQARIQDLSASGFPLGRPSKLFAAYSARFEHRRGGMVAVTTA
jgi:hypothetical protein